MEDPNQQSCHGLRLPRVLFPPTPRSRSGRASQGAKEGLAAVGLTSGRRSSDPELLPHLSQHLACNDRAQSVDQRAFHAIQNRNLVITPPGLIGRERSTGRRGCSTRKRARGSMASVRRWWAIGGRLGRPRLSQFNPQISRILQLEHLSVHKMQVFHRSLRFGNPCASTSP